MHPSRVLVLATSSLLASCGGGGGSSAQPAPPTPAPAPPTQVALAAHNYRNALTLAMGVASSAYQYAKLGASMADRWINVSTNFFPAIPCSGGGAMSIELTDEDGDRTLDPRDTLHLRWEQCSVQGTTTTGLVRVEVHEAIPLADGREFRLTITIVDLRVELANAPSTTVNFIAQVHYRRTASSDFTAIDNAVFSSGQVVGDTGTSTSRVSFDLDHATQTYEYSLDGEVSSAALGGRLEFATSAPFTGVIGEYPSAGRLSVVGNAGSTARLSEEGAAAADVATVLMAVDGNGDGIADATDPQLAWANVVPVQLFAAPPDQVAVAVPMP